MLDGPRKQELLDLASNIPQENRQELVNMLEESKELAKEATEYNEKLETLNDQYEKKLNRLEKNAKTMVVRAAEEWTRQEETKAMGEI